VSKALDLGVAQALGDLPGRGRHPVMTAEARAWVVSLACQKPKDLGYAQELADFAAPKSDPGLVDQFWGLIPIELLSVFPTIISQNCQKTI
jgi:hypothetical protein